MVDTLLLLELVVASALDSCSFAERLELVALDEVAVCWLTGTAAASEVGIEGSVSADGFGRCSLLAAGS